MDTSAKPTGPNPRYGANPISQLFFAWITPLLWKGFRRGLGPKDQTDALPKDKSKKLGDKLEQKWMLQISRCKVQGSKPRLWKSIFKTFWSSFIIDGLLLLIVTAIKSGIPILLGLLIAHFKEESTSTTQDACILGGSIVILNFLATVIGHHIELRQKSLGMRMRIACCSVMYRKIMRLSKAVTGQMAAGTLVNLMSNDVNRFDNGFIFANAIWILPLQIVLITYLIYTRVGYAAFAGVGSMILMTIPLQSFLSKLTARLRLQVATRTDERVRLMNELVTGIQVIKMYAWERPFAKVVTLARHLEIDKVRKASYLRGIYQSFMVFTERAVLFTTLVTCVFINEEITADKVFAMAQFYNVLQVTIAIYYPQAITFGAEAFISMNRIENFLLLDERIPTIKEYLKGTNKQDVEPVHVKSSGSGGAVIIQHVTASWTPEKTTLRDISIHIKPGQLCAIIGPVGSGKSSLLELLLEELPKESGTIHTNGDISYGSQEAWLTTGSVRSNILFGLPYDRLRYQNIIRVCALQRDLELFPYGDKTIVGDRGSSLSGGQKARISLARAVYRRADLYLLDDPLSAVDAHVGRHLFDQCIGNNGFLAGATRILVTHQLHYLKDADWIVILKNGAIEHQGTYRDLSNSKLDFASLLEECEDDEVEETLPTERTRKRSSAVSQTQIAHEEELASPEIEEEEHAAGLMSIKVYWGYFRAGGNVLSLLGLFFVFLLGQVVISGTDYWPNYWTQQETANRLHDIDPSINSPMLSTYDCMYVYTGFIMLCIFTTIVRSILFFKLCSKSSIRLHNRMFSNVLRATMRFFDTNTSGRILNRFSKDIGTVDEMLPKLILEALQITLVMIGILIMVTIMNPVLLVPLVVAVLLFYSIVRLYLQSAQDLKRLEGSSRSPVFSHVSSSLTGLSTIRSSDSVPALIKEFDILQDVHTSCWYLTLAAQQWLGLCMDIVSIFFIACVAFSFILMEDYFAVVSSNVGLAISQAMILTGMVQYGVRQCTDVMNNMTSVERVLQYTNLTQEQSPNKLPPDNWPSYGKIEFRGASLIYVPDEPPVLKDLTFVIESGWKVGIVGRTGAGKSSLISALFRLAPIEGAILVDGLETGRISLEHLRSKISIIPQDPVLFSATLRYNLDPFYLYDDAKLWKALEDVELKSSIDSLDFVVNEAGSNFSVGQKQLICLARAILRENRILVLDEATANVDPQTDSFIQLTIREKFQNCTVLTIAHRLNTVMDSDRVLVMDAGRPKEYGPPYDLLQVPNGALANMVNESGPTIAAALLAVAKEAAKRKGFNEISSESESSGSIVLEVEYSTNGLNIRSIQDSHGHANEAFRSDEDTKL